MAETKRASSSSRAGESGGGYETLGHSCFRVNRSYCHHFRRKVFPCKDWIFTVYYESICVTLQWDFDFLLVFLWNLCLILIKLVGLLSFTLIQYGVLHKLSCCLPHNLDEVIVCLVEFYKSIYLPCVWCWEWPWVKVVIQWSTWFSAGLFTNLLQALVWYVSFLLSYSLWNMAGNSIAMDCWFDLFSGNFCLSLQWVALIQTGHDPC